MIPLVGFVVKSKKSIYQIFLCQSCDISCSDKSYTLVYDFVAGLDTGCVFHLSLAQDIGASRYYLGKKYSST